MLLWTLKQSRKLEMGLGLKNWRVSREQDSGRKLEMSTFKWQQRRRGKEHLERQEKGEE